MIAKTLLMLGCIIITVPLTSFTHKTPAGQKAVRTIIIDAGHGGVDAGARGAYSYEKDICLDVAMKLGQQIQKELPEVKIIYTRTSDTYPELHARARQANQSRGDLFISVHVNAAPPVQHKEFTGNKTVISYTGKGKKKKKITTVVPQYRYYSTPNEAKGTETYIWGAHKTEDKQVAIRENAPMLGEENFESNYGNIDPNSPEFLALSLLKTKQFFKRSATLAGMIEEQFTKVGRISRGQRQRQVGIWVLQATAMPSILVETGYITNHSEEDYLNSPTGQQEIAFCVTAAVKEYSSWLEKQQTLTNSQVYRQSDRSKNADLFLRSIAETERRYGAK